MQQIEKEDNMINQKELKKALIAHDVTIELIAEAANVSESTVYRWLKKPERMTVGNVEIIKNLTKMSAEEFTRIFYTNTVA